MPLDPARNRTTTPARPPLSPTPGTPVTGSRWPFRLHSVSPELRRYILLTVIATVIVITISAASVIAFHEPSGTTYLVFVGLYLSASILPQFQTPDSPGTRRFNAFPTLIACAVGPLYLLPLAVLTSELLWHVQDYFRKPAERHLIPLSVAIQVVSVGAVAGIVQAVNQPVSYFAGALVCALVADAMLYQAIWTDGGPTVSEQMKQGWESRLVIPLLAATLAICVLAFPASDRASVALIPLLLIVGYTAANEVLTIRRDRDAWQALEEVVSTTLRGTTHDQAPNEHTVMVAALTGAVRLFGPTSCEIVVLDGPVGSRYHHTANSGSTQISATRVDAATYQPPTSSPTRLVRPLESSAHIHAGWMIMNYGKAVKRPNDREHLIATYAAQVASNIIVVRNYEQMKASAANKAHESLHDGLTGLGNREMLFEQAPRRLAESTAAGQYAALLLFDLDGFKRINDTLGHSAGDVLLRQVADRTQSSVRESDLAIRLGGDEFVILATHLHDPTDAEQIARTLIAALTPAITVEGIELSVEASIGIAVHERDAQDIHHLLRLADVAMYQAKSNGRGTLCWYSTDQSTDTTEQLSLATDLRDALDHDGLQLHYQPQVDLSTEQIVGMEALVRWQHPTLNMIYPVRFVPLAEHSGLIRRFTLEIIRMAVRDHAILRADNPGSSMSVNLSARNLLDQALPDDIAAALTAHSVPAHELVIEITETVAPSSAAAVDTVLQRLGEMGCKISLDDFGTGFSSLQSISRTAYTEIKVDREFVKDVADKATAQTMVRAICDIAHGHGCRVVAEGVENERTLSMLRTLGCDVAQGFYLARPGHLEDIRAWTAHWQATHPATEPAPATPGQP